MEVTGSGDLMGLRRYDQWPSDWKEVAYSIVLRAE